MSFDERTSAQPASLSATPIVFVVDDAVSMRESMELLAQRVGLQAETSASEREFLAHPRAPVPNCLVLHVALPDINGLSQQQQIGLGDHLPIIFVTGHGDILSKVRAIQAGALDFLIKPFSDQKLLKLLHAALAQDPECRIQQAALECLQRRYESLTPREREVLPLVVGGLLNKQGAAHLGISEVTLQRHRASVMRKMQADSLADLVRMADRLKIPVTLTRHHVRAADESCV